MYAPRDPAAGMHGERESTSLSMPALSAVEAWKAATCTFAPPPRAPSARPANRSSWRPAASTRPLIRELTRAVVRARACATYGIAFGGAHTVLRLALALSSQSNHFLVRVRVHRQCFLIHDVLHVDKVAHLDERVSVVGERRVLQLLVVT